MSEVQNQQQGGQQKAQDVTGQVTDQAGQVAGQAQDAAGQVQDTAGQVTDQAGQTVQGVQDTAGQVAGQAQDAAGGLLGGQGAGQSGEQEMEDYSYSDSDSESVVNDKTPQGILGQLLNLDILPPPQSDTTTLESGDANEYYGPEEEPSRE